VVDACGRPLRDLRLSVTDRCNFHCTYCRPRDKHGLTRPGMTHRRPLFIEEFAQIAAAFVEPGVRKIRITGGEPLVRRDLPRLVTALSKLALEDLCLTTNGSLLSDSAASLAAAGLKRVTVSLDALDDPTFRLMTDSDTRVSQVLAGIDAARKCGLNPVKINMVVQRGVNEHAIIPMADWARREQLELRFI
jgi:cyclic pyranopterin phosphate synthase